MVHVRPAAVAGTFYPSSASDLARQIDAMLGAVQAPETRAAPKALIVPHAGYIYSGPVAASAYAALRPIAGRVRRVVLLGPAHRVYLSGLALPDADAFETPLGVVPLDPGAASCIPWVQRSAAAHMREHSLEVQLPFLIRVLGPGFQLIPLAVGDAEPDEIAAALEALWGGPETLVVVSSDLSHYLPYDVARDVDAGTARAILDLGGSLNHEQACGATPVNGLLLLARRRGLRPVLLDIRSSGDTAGSRDEVVGYGAFAFYEGGAAGAEVADAG